MNIEQLSSAALGIVDPWYIKSVNFDSARKKLDIEGACRKSHTKTHLNFCSFSTLFSCY